MKKCKFINTSSTQKTIKGINKKKKYYFQVRAYRKDSTGAKVFGEWSKIKLYKDICVYS